MMAKDLEKALADADKCIALNSDFPKGHFRRGLILKELGRKVPPPPDLLLTCPDLT